MFPDRWFRGEEGDTAHIPCPCFQTLEGSGGKGPRSHGRSLITLPGALAAPKTASVRFSGWKVARNAARFASRSSGKGKQTISADGTNAAASPQVVPGALRPGQHPQVQGRGQGAPCPANASVCSPHQPAQPLHTKEHTNGREQMRGKNSAYIPCRHSDVRCISMTGRIGYRACGGRGRERTTRWGV